MTKVLDFFLFYGSIYTYLAVMRVEQVAAANGFEVLWRPFNLREILVEQKNTAFAENPVRMRYCWRDVERRAVLHGVAFSRQPPYPVDRQLLALRVGTIAAAEGWCAAYSKATYRAWFLEHKPSGEPDTVKMVLNRLGKRAEDIMTRAASPEVADRLRQQTEAARELGIFGSPTFAVGREIFWGDDRLEDAVAWDADPFKGAGQRFTS